MNTNNSREVSGGGRATAFRCVLGLCSAVLLSSSPTAGAAEATSTGRTLGFVLSTFAPAIYLGKDDCPQGPTLTVREAYIETLSPSERARLLKPDAAEELEKRYKLDYVFDDKGTNICQNPERFPREAQRMVQGTVARGLNLDQKVIPGHDFTSPEGEPGIDNQFYRAFGCSTYYRGLDENYGDWVRIWNVWLANGEQTTVVLLKGVDDLRNDSDVEVVIASSADIPPTDPARKIIPGGSLTVTDNPAWRHVARGSIKDGVVTTEPIDVLLNGKLGIANGLLARTEVRDFRQARFRFTVAPDGSSISGVMGAYQTITNARALSFHSGAHGAHMGGIECAKEYEAMLEVADAMPDPTTGKFTGLSMAYDVKGVSAYVFDRNTDHQILAKASKPGK